MENVSFTSNGCILKGHLYLPIDYNSKNRYTAIIVSGSWTTVKEQMAGLYAQRLSEQGFIAMAFDFRNFGESEGKPRYFESPSSKVEDIIGAVTYLKSRKDIDNKAIGALGICAGAMYTLIAAAHDKRITAVVTVASWLHDSEAVKLFYGGSEGVAAKLSAAMIAEKEYHESSVAAYIPTISTTDMNAAMYGSYDYYLNPERGAISQWSADQFAVMSWKEWLTTNPMPCAKQIKAPTLMIHSDGAVLPDYTRTFFGNLAADQKQLHWIKTELPSPFHQFDFYDQEAEVSESIQKASEWFKLYLIG